MTERQAPEINVGDEKADRIAELLDLGKGRLAHEWAMEHDVAEIAWMRVRRLGEGLDSVLDRLIAVLVNHQWVACSMGGERAFPQLGGREVGQPAVRLREDIRGERSK